MSRGPAARRIAGTLAVVAAALAVALGARLAVPLPGAAVPQTAQTLAVVLAGGLLGPLRGGLAVGVYWLLALAGLPVLAGGASGPAPFLGPGGGFLAGFLPAAVLAGAARRRPPLVFLAAALAAHATILACGWARLAVLLGAEPAFVRGVAPFLVGGLVKSLLATGVVFLTRDIAHRRSTKLAGRE